jgi:hypothetical protein
MEFTLSFQRPDKPGTTYTLMIKASSKPERLVDFDGGKAKLAPGDSYEEFLEIRAFDARNDRIEIYYLDAQNNPVVWAKVVEDESPPLRVGFRLKMAEKAEAILYEAKVISQNCW